MKKKSKIIIGILAAAITTVALGATALAAPEEDFLTDSKLDQRIATLQQRQQKIEDRITSEQNRLEKLSARQPENEFLQLVTQTQMDIVANRITNLELAADNNQLRLKFLTALDALRDGGGSVPEDIAAVLRDDNAQVMDILSTLKDTRGDIRDVMDAYKGDIRNRDEEALQAVHQQIVSIQQNRAELLTQMNTLLMQMMNLLESLPEA